MKKVLIVWIVSLLLWFGVFSRVQVLAFLFGGGCTHPCYVVIEVPPSQLLNQAATQAAYIMRRLWQIEEHYRRLRAHSKLPSLFARKMLEKVNIKEFFYNSKEFLKMDTLFAPSQQDCPDSFDYEDAEVYARCLVLYPDQTLPATTAGLTYSPRVSLTADSVFKQAVYAERLVSAKAVSDSYDLDSSRSSLSTYLVDSGSAEQASKTAATVMIPQIQSASRALRVLSAKVYASVVVLGGGR